MRQCIKEKTNKNTMTRKQELKELKSIASGQISITGTNRLPCDDEILAAKAVLAKLEEKDNKSKARFLIFNEGRQKELKRRIEAIAKQKRINDELKRVEAAKAALNEVNKNINDFAEENNLK
jgi:hypothetical protein